VTQDVPENLKAKRGFAAMDPERRREIARKGGASVPADKRSYSKDRELAAKAGAMGGKAYRTTPQNTD
jgi:general stress protein YciG